MEFIEFIKKFFARPSLENKVQKSVYTIWLLLVVIIIVFAILIGLAPNSGDSESEFWVGFLSVVVLTFIRNKLIEIWG
ncbi:MAG: hypothetical protein Q8N69_02500 [bacterium]|nr:hypothetical protein [bacterium]